VTGRQVVVDASVALKWRLRDEEATAQADALLDDFLGGRLKLSAPSLLDYELANALVVAVRRGRLQESAAGFALSGYREYSIIRFSFEQIEQLTFELATRYGRSAYDGAYLALARSLGVWFFTGDKRLYNSVGTELPWVKWIGDYNYGDIPAGEP
jgi:predicted nucleic acid-binding protein